MAEVYVPGSRPQPALPKEPAVLRHSFQVLVVGGFLALLAFGVAYRLERGSAFGPRFEVGLRAATGVAAVVAGLLTWARLELSRREHHLTADAELTERYGRSVSQLGGADPVIRVGGVFAMERFALDAAARAGERRDVDWRMALDLLAAFARDRSSDTRTTYDDIDEAESRAHAEHRTPRADVAEAVRVLGRFRARCDITIDVPYDLTRTFLPAANLAQADLSRANLTGANLTRATMSGANLAQVDLADADLTDADLTGANLIRATISRANLGQADLAEANLTEANLTATSLHAANLAGANLTRARLSHANLDGVRFDEATVWPDGSHDPPQGVR